MCIAGAVFWQHFGCCWKRCKVSLQVVLFFRLSLKVQGGWYRGFRFLNLWFLNLSWECRILLCYYYAWLHQKHFQGLTRVKTIVSWSSHVSPRTPWEPSVYEHKGNTKWLIYYKTKQSFPLPVMTNVLPVCLLLHLDYIIPRLISCVFQSLPVARPSNGLPLQSGLSTYRAPELFLWRSPWLQRQKNSLIWRLKERAPAVCHYRLIKT